MFDKVVSNIGLLAVRSPGKIVGPIAGILGVFFNAIFNLIFAILQTGSLGIAIILFTIIIKMILMPLTYKQQKSMFKMQKMQPEMKKIQDKYKDRTDRESQQRMSFELQELQRANGTGLLSGCLPMLIQLPILYGMFYLFQQAYMYVDVIGANYNAIADILLQAPVAMRMDALTNIVIAKNMTVDVAVAGDLVALIHQFTAADMASITSVMGQFASQLEPLFAQKMSMEYFLGINMVLNPGMSFPGIIVPIVTGLSTYVSTKLMSAGQPQQNETAGMMKTMNIIMPLMLGFMAINMPAGLGIYWTITNIIQLLQQRFLRNYFVKKDAETAKEAN